MICETSLKWESASLNLHAFAARWSNSLPSSNCHCILVRQPGRCNAFRASQITQKRLEIDLMCQLGANRNSQVGYRIDLSPTPRLLKLWGSEINPTFKLLPNGWRRTKMSTGYISEHIAWLWSESMNNHSAFAKTQTSERRSSTICAVVERHDHRCGGWWPRLLITRIELRQAIADRIQQVIVWWH